MEITSESQMQLLLLVFVTVFLSVLWVVTKWLLRVAFEWMEVPHDANQCFDSKCGSTSERDIDGNAVKGSKGAYDRSRYMTIELHAHGFLRFTRQLSQPWKNRGAYDALKAAMGDVLQYALPHATFAFCVDETIVFVIEDEAVNSSGISASRITSTATRAFVQALMSPEGAVDYKEQNLNGSRKHTLRTCDRMPPVWFQTKFCDFYYSTAPEELGVEHQLVQHMRRRYSSLLSHNRIDKLLQGLATPRQVRGKNRVERINMLWGMIRPDLKIAHARGLLHTSSQLPDLHHHLRVGTFAVPMVDLSRRPARRVQFWNPVDYGPLSSSILKLSQ